MHVSSNQVKQLLFQLMNNATFPGEMSELVTHVRKEIYEATTDEDPSLKVNPGHVAQPPK